MTDEQAILAAILAHPDDDTPRLALADHLDETATMVPCVRGGVACDGKVWSTARPTWEACDDYPACRGTGFVPDGRAARAEFIRVQVELAGMPDEAFAYGVMEAVGTRVAEMLPAAQLVAPDVVERCRRFQELRARGRELLAAHGREWSKEVVTALSGGGFVLGDLMPGGDGWFEVRRSDGTVNGWRFSRGFAATLRGPLAAFWADRACGACDGSGVVESGVHRPPYRKPCPDCTTGRVSGPTPALVRLVAGEPVTAVEVSDKEPFFSSTWAGRGVWFRDADDNSRAGELAYLPRVLFELLPGESIPYDRELAHKEFPSPAAARAALSAAVLAHCRAIAAAPA